MRCPLRCVCSPNQQFPELLCRGFAQVIISQHNVDSAKDGFVELGNSVCRKEHNPLAIFQFAEEHGNEAIANYVFRRSFFEEDIRFINEENRIIITSELEDSRELLL